MYQGHKQVYRSTIEQLKALGLNLKENGIAALSTVLGEAWVAAAETPITVEGNYVCVLRNNHVVHVQALLSETVLHLTTPMYPAPLGQLNPADRNSMPPVDEIRWYAWGLEGAYPYELPEGADVPSNVFKLILVAGPHVDCRMPVVYAPAAMPKAHDWQTYADSLVNRVAAADSDVVWWKAVTAPPHYTKEMIGEIA